MRLKIDIACFMLAFGVALGSVAAVAQSPSSAAQKGPHAKTKAELNAYEAATGESNPEKLEAAAVEFAERYSSSELRPFLFQKAMGLYQQANNPDKTLEMARAVLKYDPGNPVALLTAAELLAERTQDNALDRDARLNEADDDAQSTLQHAGQIVQPANLSAEQFADAMAQLRGDAHEVLATVAYKKHDYEVAIKELNFAVTEEREHTDARIWLRLAAAHDKNGERTLAIAAVKKAIAASAPGSPVRELAEKEKARLEATAPAQGAGQPPKSTGGESH